MIKTFRHDIITGIEKRDKEVNTFIQEHGSWSQQTDINNTVIITTIYYGQK